MLPPKPPVVKDKDALADSQVARGEFMVTLGDPKMLNIHLGIVLAAYDSIKAQKVAPDFVVVYAGPAVKYLNNASSGDTAAAGSVTMDIESKVSRLAKALGMKTPLVSPSDPCASPPANARGTYPVPAPACPLPCRAHP